MNAIDAVSWKVKAIAAVAVVAIIAASGAAISWWATSTIYKADIATLKANHAEERGVWEREKIAISTHAQQATADAINRMRIAQEAAAAADLAAQEKLANAKIENEALRADVAAGRKRVSILTANLAAVKHATGGSASGGGVGDEIQIDLSAEGQRAVLDLRESVEQDDAVIQYLQNYILDVANQCKR